MSVEITAPILNKPPKLFPIQLISPVDGPSEVTSNVPSEVHPCLQPDHCRELRFSRSFPDAHGHPSHRHNTCPIEQLPVINSWSYDAGIPQDTIQS
jgi:hypothetical protein